MRKQLQNLGETLAHAYLLIGEHEQVETELFDYLESKRGITKAGNPNILHKDFSRMGIDDVRSVIEYTSKTAVGSDANKIIILGIQEITIEAQNAMLKLIEEPSEGTLFFIIAPYKYVFLPTIRSRVQIIEDAQIASQDIQVQVDAFLVAGYTARMAQIAEYLGDSKKGVSPRRSEGAQFITHIASTIMACKTQIENWLEVYQEVSEYADYARDRSSSLKYIFEYLSVRIPQLKK